MRRPFRGLPPGKILEVVYKSLLEGTPLGLVYKSLLETVYKSLLETGPQIATRGKKCSGLLRFGCLPPICGWLEVRFGAYGQPCQAVLCWGSVVLPVASPPAAGDLDKPCRTNSSIAFLIDL